MAPAEQPTQADRDVPNVIIQSTTGPVNEDSHTPPSHSASTSLQNSPTMPPGAWRDPLPARTAPSLQELPDELIELISQRSLASEPSRKRRKTVLEQGMIGIPVAAIESAASDPELDYIVVKQSDLDIKCSGSKLSTVDIPADLNRVLPRNLWRFPRSQDLDGSRHIEIINETRRCLLRAPLTIDMECFEDVCLALEVDLQSHKWARGQGKLWTELALQLLRNDGYDTIRITVTVKWNITTSPLYIRQIGTKIKALPKILSRYFPDPNQTQSGKWSAQDFYNSVHTPDKNDQGAASLTVDGLEADLYPFQKRSVQWLLRKEGVEWSAIDKRITSANPIERTAVPMSFLPVVDHQGRQCYVSHLFGLVTLDVTPFRILEQDLKGGILAEEMGLGKTVEMISLISLHRRPKEHNDVVYDLFTGQNVRLTSATLIIAPPSISLQWISEINKHAPHLKVMHYEGIRVHSGMDSSDLLESLATSDIVISTYNVLAGEIHFTQLNPEKKLRRESKYPRPKSPLMALQFFRVVMDEAQMIESGVSNAAVVARMVPRVNAWCVTGTPVRKDVNDLLGLLVFLRYEPYASTKHIWTSLISSYKQQFRTLFGTLALRHSKQSVREELKLPAQRRYVITMPFTPIEEQHYQELFNQMCDVLGLDAQGAPLVDGWRLGDQAEVMRRWLVRLRQTALHPEVGGRNRRALGHKDGPLRTVDQVLEVMIDQTDLAVRTEQRNLLTSKLKRGQLFENSPRVQEALDIWTEAANEVSVIVEECRLQLRQEIARNIADEKSLDKPSHSTSMSDSDSSSEKEEADLSSRLGTFRNRLRAALEIQHMAIFFCANANFQIKSNEDMTQPDSPEFQALEKLETESYESAKKLRREILQEIYRKADRLMRKISKKAATQTFVEIPEFSSNPPKGGLESRRITEHLDTLGLVFDAQANQIDEWREQTIQFLLRPLVDEDEGLEITGDEYEESTKTQDEVIVYVQALRALIADRHDALTGLENKLVEHEVKVALRLAKDGDGAFPEKALELLSARNQLKPTKEMGSVRGSVGELRVLAASLRTDAQNGSSRAENELSIVEKQLSGTQKQLSEQIKTTAALEKEIELFTRVMNTRLEYYRQLQQISDMVAPYEGPNNETALGKMLQDEEKFARKVAAAKTKRRYLLHLRNEATNPEEQRICVICRESFEIGALTVCGHQYCKECIQLWWSAHRNCPVCKKKLIQADLHEITYKPQELSIQAEVPGPQERASPSATSRKSAIYSEISKNKLAEIKNIELDGPSFTTKVDTLARHLIWLRDSDPGAKSIIYSQFKDFLDVLALAFQRFRIGYSSIDRSDGIEKFKQDPSVECFLLHARAHSSGLNLVNASHVFLCEPLLNTALELQAIARVDRIGQHQETNVWLYLVDGTIEESIYQLSVKRRLEHIGQRLSRGKGKERELSPNELIDTNLEEANSMELQQAPLNRLLAKGATGGEMVEEKDLWECLFGAGHQRPAKRKLDDIDKEVGRHLRAEAAEVRQVVH
ncbi:p-loop containing nucleoside triphosphate hydrolase [Venustampulla echinocandica]|uniref:p-loop containing nucleoside triphosphate hydrolase n=1 Tax=Venustampulla echinocandica TaxID=2656787 RepID=A0A370U0P9_9HELO|nr:p-loop containing nucleoside triphosphate hydrolase [Venustampulla echinocandica]RDL41323.1 p-loop containing nucleoside triphosphate hydrolase [Venustampulla echinocandica]